MIQNGYFVIADISGYTQFLTQSELEHAQGILNMLLQSLVKEIKPPLHVSNFQGDAVLSYAPGSDIFQGETLVDTVENLYVAFAETRETMRQNTTCPCAACRNMPELDLKLFIHHGKYALQEIEGRRELSGQDVILIHRLMENDIRESTGIVAYAAYTTAALSAMKMSAWKASLVSHSESYEHIGEVDVFIHDLRAAWGKRRRQKQFHVEPCDAHLCFDTTVPVPSSLAWDYVTEPEHRRVWLGFEAVQRRAADGRRVGVNAEYHCVHAEGEFPERVVGWNPFERFTMECVSYSGIRFFQTYCFSAAEDGTRVELRISVARSKNPLKKLFDSRKIAPQMAWFQKVVPQCMADLRNMALQDVNEERISRSVSPSSLVSMTRPVMSDQM